MTKKLVEIKKPEFDVELDIRYATSNNFTGTPVYKKNGAFLHPKAAEALNNSIRAAKKHGLRLKIFDTFRPKEAQQKLWNHSPNPEFLSNPETGSCPHCRGVAIDLTLIDKDGMELEMGTEFDAFTPLSHHGNTEISPTAQKNRELLKEIMMETGWDFYRNEWWHYQLFNCREYELLTDAAASTKMI